MTPSFLNTRPSFITKETFLNAILTLLRQALFMPTTVRSNACCEPRYGVRGSRNSCPEMRVVRSYPAPGLAQGRQTGPRAEARRVRAWHSFLGEIASGGNRSALASQSGARITPVPGGAAGAAEEFVLSEPRPQRSCVNSDMPSLRLFTIAISIVVSVWTIRLSGIFVTPETRRVPIERLVTNLERALASNPKDVQTRINLARLHGMAYALKTEEVTVARWPHSTIEEPYYGVDQNLIPYRPKAAATPDEETRARDHLKRSIAHYEAALAIDPQDLLARLGYGWMLDQSGDKTRAVVEYRRIIRDAWDKDLRRPYQGAGTRFFITETAGYLIPLLDQARDAAEIADLRAKMEVLEQKPRAITPLAIPLSDDVPPEAVAAPHARIAFDADGSALPRRWTWISSRAGWLVHDPGRTGEITSALQWFGNVTFWLFWENGYQALAALDDDADGELAGDELRDLAIWHDRNSNGTSEPGEVRPVSAYGIVALSCRYVKSDRAMFAAIASEGVRLANGRTRPTYDVVLRTVDVMTLTKR